MTPCRAPCALIFVPCGAHGIELHRRPFHEPLNPARGPKGKAMTAQLDELMEKLRSVEAEIETELAKRREELRFRLDNRRIVFEQEVLRIHRAIKTRASRYFIDANPWIVLSAPVIYSLIVPFVLIDIWVMVLSGDLLSDLQNSQSAPPRLPGVRPPPSRLSQHHREDQLRLLLLLQRRDRLRARGGVAHRDLSLIHISEPTRRTPISYAV